MAIYGEPKDGDFVRYIETLNRQAGAAPGQVMPRNHSGSTALNQKAASAQAQTDAAVYTYASSSDSATPTYPSEISPGSTQQDNRQSTTLASRSGQRHLSLALVIAAAVALWSAAHRLITAINTRSLDFDAMVPVIFLLVCAGMLFKGARSARRKQNHPLVQLPPLSATYMGRTPKK